jgi:N-acetylmuramoyl-L-alanine amidase
MDSVTVSEDTVEAVDRVLSGEDSSNGALYFRSVRAEQAWHDGALRRVLEHGNHIFYTI